jgi:hypothetical protein
MDYLTKLRRFHQHRIQPYLGIPKGCSPHTLAQFEQSLAHELPLAYRQYLAWMGEDYSGIFQGTNCFMPDVATNTAALPTLLAENQIAFALPVSYLVFCMHQGYVAVWFTLPKESDDPPVWFFSEGQALTQPITAGKFTDFLFTDMQGLAAALAKTKRTN